MVVKYGLNAIITYTFNDLQFFFRKIVISILQIASSSLVRYTQKNVVLFLALGGLYSAPFQCSHRDCTASAISAQVQVLVQH